MLEAMMLFLFYLMPFYLFVRGAVEYDVKNAHNGCTVGDFIIYTVWGLIPLFNILFAFAVWRDLGIFNKRLF